MTNGMVVTVLSSAYLVGRDAVIEQFEMESFNGRYFNDDRFVRFAEESDNLWCDDD